MEPGISASREKFYANPLGNKCRITGSLYVNG